eukprot:Polyplicarium_translucidae@DN3113_c0_g1_i1.p1
MQDRLGDLREAALVKNRDAAEKMFAGPSAAAVAAKGKGGQFDIEAQMGIAVDGRDVEEASGFMKEYQSNVAVIKQGINDVNNGTKMFKDLRNRALQATSPDDEREISHRVTSLMDTTNRTTMMIKNALQRLKEENSDFASKQPGSSEVKIRENLHGALTRKFREVLVEYQKLQTDYKQDVKGKVTRQVKIVYPEASDEELQTLVDGGDAAQAIRQSIMGGHESLKNAVSDIQDKYRDIQRLERSGSTPCTKPCVCPNQASLNCTKCSSTSRLWSTLRER